MQGEPDSTLLLRRPWAPHQPRAPEAHFLPAEGTVHPQPSPLPPPCTPAPEAVLWMPSVWAEAGAAPGVLL